jgi:hypothetical protein
MIEMDDIDMDLDNPEVDIIRTGPRIVIWLEADLKYAGFKFIWKNQHFNLTLGFISFNVVWGKARDFLCESMVVGGSKLAHDAKTREITEEFRRRDQFFQDIWTVIRANPAGEYTRPTPDYGDIMTVDEWLDCVRNGSFVDYDGSGGAARMVKGKLAMETRYIYPSACDKLPSDATHVVWFNR